MEGTGGMGWIVLIPVVSIIGGMALAALGIYALIRKREFEHRERLAMIEQGLTPGKTGDVASNVRDAVRARGVESFLSDAAAGGSASDGQRIAQLRRGGFIVIAVGIGMFLMIYLTSGDIRPAMGIGAFMCVVGAAIFVSSYIGAVGPRPGSSSQPPGTGTQTGSGG